MPSKTKRNKWIEKGIHYLMRANRSWNIPMNSFANHLNGKTKF
jgi:hypothetical protein